MAERQDSGVGTEAAPSVREEQPDARRSYHPPVFERLGEWTALTLQQSIGIG